LAGSGDARGRIAATALLHRVGAARERGRRTDLAGCCRVARPEHGAIALAYLPKAERRIG
jgi:hypothetical protein